MRTSKQIMIICDPVTAKVSRIIDCDTDEEYMNVHKAEVKDYEIVFFHSRGNYFPSPIQLKHVAELQEQYEKHLKELNKNKQKK